MTFLDVHGLSPDYRAYPGNKKWSYIVAHQFPLQLTWIWILALLSLETSVASHNERKSVLVTNSLLKISGQLQISLPLLVIFNHMTYHDHT